LASPEESGQLSVEWARSHMPVFALAEKYLRKKDDGRNLFQDLRLASCLHVSKETAVFVESLKSFGMNIHLVAANPLSSQDDVASFLRSIGVSVSAKSNESIDEYTSSINSAAESNPEMIVDDGGELHVAYSQTGSLSCRGGTDETTSGTFRLKAIEKAGKLTYPVIPVNDAETKHLFDNKYGSGQSAIDGLFRAAGLLLSGKCVVVAGYGWVGRGVALRSRGMGSRVVVTEVDGRKALEAHLDGFQVMPMMKAAELGDIFLTCTGQIDVVRSEHFARMKDGAIVGNVGHFDTEIDVSGLNRLAIKTGQSRRNVTRFELENKKSIYLLCQGRVVNLVAAEGHPPEIMQLSFANQLLSLYYLLDHESELRDSKSRVLEFPQEIDALVTNLALEGFDLKIDSLNSSQKEYAQSY